MNTIADIAAIVSIVVGCGGLLLVAVIVVFRRKFVTQLREQANSDETASRMLGEFELRGPRVWRWNLAAGCSCIAAIGVGVLRFV